MMSTDPACEDVLLAAMAIADGERPPVEAAAVEAHLASCASCRAETEALAASARLLDACRRRPAQEDLWPALARRIGAAPRTEAALPAEAAPSDRRSAWAPFLALAVALVAGRAVIATTPDASTALKLLAVALAVAAFAWVRENPFKIETELRLG